MGIRQAYAYRPYAYWYGPRRYYGYYPGPYPAYGYPYWTAPGFTYVGPRGSVSIGF